MINEKDKMIVDAVNFFKGEFIFESGQCEDEKLILKALKESLDCPEKTGDFCGGYTGYSKHYRELVCTQEEYNQCIREMSEGAFVPNAEPEFVYGQDVYLKDDEWKGIELKFGCLNLSGNWAILLHECGYAYAKLSNISSKPFKTKEEIELEDAEKLQILELMYLYQKHYDRVGVEDFFKDMQENGHLAEVLIKSSLNSRGIIHD